MSATQTTFSYGTESPVEDATANSPTELMAMLNNLLGQLNAFNDVDPASGHVHNGVDSAAVSGETGEGIDAIQSTGASFAVGTFVYVTGKSGVNATVAKAQAIDPSNTSLYAQYVVLTALATAVAGKVFKRGRLTAQNTSGGTVSRPVWLNTVAGGFTVTCPQPAGCQVVGQIEAVSATVGIINVDIRGPIAQSSAHEV